MNWSSLEVRVASIADSSRLLTRRFQPLEYVEQDGLQPLVEQLPEGAELHLGGGDGHVLKKY